ncbi:hypothetical protein ACVB8X_40005 [Streptomyces sp. NRAIS4]
MNSLQTAEADLDAVLAAAKADLGVKKNGVKAARGRVRQVARQRRRGRRSKLVRTIAPAVKRTAFYGLTVIGVAAFGIAIALIVTGSFPASLPLFTTAGAAWRLAYAVRR